MEKPPKRRRRPALSCVECRRRKIKCDRNSPCGHCISVKIQCTFKIYVDGLAHGKLPLSLQLLELPASSAATMEGLETHSNQPADPRTTPSISVRDVQGNGKLRRHDFDSPRTRDGNATNHERATNTTGDTNSPAYVRTAGHELQDLSERVRQLEYFSLRQSGIPTQQVADNHCEQPLDPRSLGAVLDKTRGLGRSQSEKMPVEFEKIILCYAHAIGRGDEKFFQDGETRALVAQMGTLIQECKLIARNMKAIRPTRSLPSPSPIFEAPLPRDMADIMVNLYFTSFESICRILHEPTFRVTYQQFWSDPQSLSIDKRLTTVLVISIGTSLHTGHDSSDLRQRVQQSIYAAQTWLSGPLEKDRLTVTGVMVHCLTLLARQIFSIGGDLTWVSVGSLVHGAMQLGLHRDPKHLLTMSVLEGEVRRRLWATVMEMAAQSSLESRMPPRLSLDEFDTEPPSNVDDDDLDQSTTWIQPRPKEIYTSTSIQLLLLESLPTRLRMLQLLYGFRSEMSYTNTLEVSSIMMDACRKCGMSLKQNADSGVTAFQRNLVDLIMCRFLISLHMPFASEARTSPQYYYSLKVCLDAAMAIITPETDECFSHLRAVGGGMFRESIRVAETVILLELLGQVEARRMDGSSHRSSPQIALLKESAQSLMSLSLERIRHGETNIKNHMFLSMAMAQADAIETESSQEFQVARAAVDSLNLCLELLRFQANDASVATSTDLVIPETLPGEQFYSFGLDLDPLFSEIDFL